jgi:hypothetical protein
MSHPHLKMQNLGFVPYHQLYPDIQVKEPNSPEKQIMILKTLTKIKMFSF